MPPAYRLDATAAQVAAFTRADRAGDVWPGGEVLPGGYAPVVVHEKDKGRCIVPRHWGVPPPPRGEHVVPFVRNLESPVWIGILRHTQFSCLVPMTHFRKGTDWLAISLLVAGILLMGGTGWFLYQYNAKKQMM